VRHGWTLVELAAATLDHGARFLQVRAKGTSAGVLLETVTAIVARADAVGALVVVNDRADIARLARAGGVHVGQDDLAPALVRTIVGPNRVVGLSTHSMDQRAAALEQPISYIAAGPVFGTNTKATGYQPIGLAEVRRAARQIAASGTPGMPLVAIGGITLETAPSIIEAGAQAVAVISDLFVTGNPVERVSQFLQALRE
jgi:thiamine-phosphate pyrophosphorylase